MCWTALPSSAGLSCRFPRLVPTLVTRCVSLALYSISFTCVSCLCALVNRLWAPTRAHYRQIFTPAAVFHSRRLEVHLICLTLRFLYRTFVRHRFSARWSFHARFTLKRPGTQYLIGIRHKGTRQSTVRPSPAPPSTLKISRLFFQSAVIAYSSTLGFFIATFLSCFDAQVPLSVPFPFFLHFLSASKIISIVFFNAYIFLFLSIFFPLIVYVKPTFPNIPYLSPLVSISFVKSNRVQAHIFSFFHKLSVPFLLSSLCTFTTLATTFSSNMPSKARHSTAESSLDTKPQVNLKALPPRCNSKTSTSPHHLVLDLSLPSHIVNDRSLFTTYTSSRKLHRTIFGNDIIIEGYGDVHVRTFAGTKSILFRLRDCWHVPSSPHHFLSCKRVISQGKQVMLAGRIPRMIHSHKDRLAEPQLPKYVPFTRDGGVFVLEFQIPGPVEVSGIQPNATPLFSLHASSFRSFAGMAACASAPVPSMYQLQPSAALSLHHPNLPLLSPVTVNFQSATMVSMLSQYNVLLDSRCACHIVCDRRLFCSYASTEKPMSVDTANCGSLEVLGIGDVEFWCPFRDVHVVFTMHGCLYAPKAPLNLLSVGTLVEHGMSCLFSSGSLTKVFYPQNHAKLPGFTFSAVVMNCLSFLKLVFLSPVDSMSPK